MNLHKSVEQLFVQFSSDLEGVYFHPYSDVRRLVTTAMGKLIDPISIALTLPWKIGDRLATEIEVRDDWQAIKTRAIALTDAELQHWTAKMQAPLTSIRISQDDVSDITLRQLHANADYITKHLMPGFPSFPADAQMGIMSTAWAIGAAFDQAKPPRPELVKACNEGDWLAAMVHARLRETGNAGVINRNRRQELCFQNAQTVRDRGLEPAGLWWPNVAPKDDSLKTLAVKALDLGIARDTNVPPPDDDSA